MTDSCGHCDEHTMNEIKKRLLPDSILSYRNYRCDVQFLLQELDQYKTYNEELQSLNGLLELALKKYEP